MHLRHLNPLPKNLGDVLKRYKKVVVPEMNLGQLVWVLRAKYLVDAISYSKVQGKPFKQSEIEAKIEEVVRVTATLPVYSKKDFQTDQEVRWCPGCGDYAILSAVQSVFPELGIPSEKFVVVSGIGCSSRFPYYMNTYGFHTIHGRAPAVATGIKISAARPRGLGGHRRRRRALDRRQPHDPHAPPQRGAQGPALQQQDLRPHQGPVLAHLGDRQEGEVHALRLGGPALQPALAGPRARRPRSWRARWTSSSRT